MDSKGRMKRTVNKVNDLKLEYSHTQITLAVIFNPRQGYPIYKSQNFAPIQNKIQYIP